MPRPGIFEVFEFLRPKERTQTRVSSLRIANDGSVYITLRYSRVPNAFPELARRLEAEVSAYIRQGTPLSQETIHFLGPKWTNEVLAFAAGRPVPGGDFVEPFTPRGTGPRFGPRTLGDKHRLPEMPTGKEPRDVLDEGAPFGGDFVSIEGGRQASPPGEEFFMPHVSIPGGVAGMAQQTRATLARVGGSLGLRGRGGTRRKRRKARLASGSRKARRASPRRKRSGGKRKYNSAAWMAKIRKMRKRK